MPFSASSGWLVAEAYPALSHVFPQVLAGPFARAFRKAEFWTTDKQYAFPLNLPATFLGFPAKVNVLPESSAGTSLWGGEFEHEVLTAKASKESVYQEVCV